jgi:hypothetical protein
VTLDGQLMLALDKRDQRHAPVSSIWRLFGFRVRKERNLVSTANRKPIIRSEVSNHGNHIAYLIRSFDGRHLYLRGSKV